MPKRRRKAQLSESERLKLFVELAEQLGGSSYINNQNGAKFTLRWEADTGFEHKFQSGSDHDHFRSFLTDFRKFILSDDPVHFFSICNIVLRRLPDGELLDIATHARDRAAASLKTGKLQLVRENEADNLALETDPMADIKGDPVPPERILDLWINTIFHTDTLKRKELEDLQALAGGLLEFTFVDTINIITNQIGRVRGVITEALVKFPECLTDSLTTK